MTQGNNNLVRRCDEVWVFGPISSGVLAEIIIAKNLEKPVKYFRIDKPANIISIDKTEAEMEKEVAEFRGEL